MSEFHNKGYKIIKGLISKGESKKLLLYCQKRKGDNDAILNDKQAIKSPSFYNDKVFKKLHKNLLSKIEKESKLKLFKTYTYWRMYKKGIILKAHTDRVACEVSITLDIGGDKWGLYIMDRNENPKKVILNAGDALLYRGCELSHWRPKFKGDNHAQIFFHYVDQNGPNAWAKDDIIKGV